MSFYVYRDAKDLWRWILFDHNKMKIAESARGYKDLESIGRSIGLVMTTSSSTPVVEE